MKFLSKLLFLWLFFHQIMAGGIDDKTVVRLAKPKVWETFPLSQVRLLPGSPFFHAMKVSQGYLLDADVDQMLNGPRKRVGLEEKGPYPGSNQPKGTRPGYLNHYLSGISLMYAQSGDPRFLERVEYIIQTLWEIETELDSKREKDPTFATNAEKVYEKLLNGELELHSPDELGYPWGGMGGNRWYGVHKELAALRDAYIYTDNEEALKLMIKHAEPIKDFVLRANPDLFDGMLIIEHGGMNEVFADLYVLTGEMAYMEVSKKFNHQKVVLNIANGKDVLYGRHANAQVPIFAGTAKQYQLTGDEISYKATGNFLHMIYQDHMTAIGGNSRYERFGRPGHITDRLGFTANETCNTYNMLKVALNYFQSTGELEHMDYFERALYNHILASQDPESGGVTYYTALMPGFFKSYSKGFDLEGIWCCVGTGMENHSKYGEAIYFHNHKDLYVNLFIPSELSWEEKGLKLTLNTKFPEEDVFTMEIDEKGSFTDQIYLRYPGWVKGSIRITINDVPVKVEGDSGGYIRLASNWEAGDVIKVEIPQEFHLEAAKDDPNMVAIFRGPLVMAGELGTDKMPGPDLVRHAHNYYKNWVPPTDDIPTLVVNKLDPESWLASVKGSALQYKTVKAGMLKGKSKEVSLIPYYKMHHQRYNVYWKMFSKDELNLRNSVVSDEINPARLSDEIKHNLKGENHDTIKFKDDRHFWENNRIGRSATDGGWFSYDMKVNKDKDRNYLVVTYWGSATKAHVFDVIINDKVIKREDLYDRWPLTYYEVAYEIPQELIKGKDKVTVRFQAQPGYNAGAVFGLKMTSDPDTFPNYSFY